MNHIQYRRVKRQGLCVGSERESTRVRGSQDAGERLAGEHALQSESRRLQAPRGTRRRAARRRAWITITR